jgi:hypothetical protein
MDLTNVITELRAELNKIDVAIRALEQTIAFSGVRRRGRPPKWMIREDAPVQAVIRGLASKSPVVLRRKLRTSPSSL